MKRIIPITVLLCCFSLLLNAQSELKLFLSDSLVFKDISGNIIADPFTGGIESPRFYKMHLNDDTKEDLVVFDRATHKVSTYINNGGVNAAVYRYAPEFEAFFPKGKFNYFIEDVDRDGFKDIICGNFDRSSDLVLYMNEGKALPNISFKFKGSISYLHYQPIVPGYRNSLGNPIQHVNALEDIDGDGDYDYVQLSSAGGNLQFFLNTQVEKGLPQDSLDFNLVELCFGYFGEGNNNSILLNGCFGSKYYIRRHTGGTSIQFLDMDKDGDKDLVLGNNEFKNLLFLENGYEDYQAKYDSMISWDSIFPRNTVQANAFIFPMASYADITGDGVKDMVVSPAWNPDYFEKMKNTHQTMLYENKGQTDSPIFVYAGNNFLMANSIDLGNYNSPVFYDYDGDGDQDFFIAYSGSFEITGHAADRVALYINEGTKTNPVFKLSTMDFGGFSTYNLSNSKMAIFDFDKDGKYEFFFGQADGTIKYFKYSGLRTAPSFTLASSSFGGITEPSGLAAPAFWDFDADGKNDLLLGCREGKIRYYRNTGTNAIPSFTLITDTLGGMATNEFRTNTNPNSFASYGNSTPIVADLNGNGKMEIVSGSLQGEIFAWKTSSGAFDTFVQYKNFTKYLNILGDTLDNFYFGLKTTVAAADLDGDTIADLIVGNSAGGFYYLSGKARVFSVAVPKVQAKTLGVRLYPNPTTGILYIQKLPANVLSNIHIFDLTGKELLSAETAESNYILDMEALNKGIYFVKIKAEGYAETTYKISKL